MRSDLPARLDVPLLLTDEVVHLGTLDHAQRGKHYASSQEHHALSVSHAPHAWKRIARLGGVPMHLLDRTGGCFIDALEVQRQPAWNEVLADWAMAQGLAKRTTRWRAWVCDTEIDDWTYTTHTTETAAAEEVLDQEGDTNAPGPDGRPSVEKVIDLIATPALALRLGLTKKTSIHHVPDAVLMVWADENLPEVDGLWWTETYDPSRLSAPRGGIFPSRLNRWTVSPGDPRVYKDDKHGQRLNVDVRPIPTPGTLPDPTPVSAAPPADGRKSVRRRPGTPR